jgi:hypothetical protein
LAVLVGTALASACSDGQPPSSNPSPIPSGGGSAGTGGIVEPTPVAGTSDAGQSGGGSPPDACLTTPPGQLALIDDFDDGDSIAAYEPERDAYWFTIVDDTDGRLEPEGAFVPVAGAYRGTKGAHLKASGFSDWGAALAANLSHESALRCPFNASGFAGLRFVARGSGRIRLQLGMPEVIDKEFGGKCDESAGQVCYDHHGLFITLQSEFKVYEVSWDQLSQRGFGAPVKFNPKTIMSLYFSMEREDLPVDMWIDQVELWDGTPSPGDGSGGAGGASGSDGGGASGSDGGGAGGDG